MDPLKIPRWGPKPVRKIWDLIEVAVNARTPKEGLGTKVKENKDGVQVSAEVGASAGLEASLEPEGAGSSGTPVDLYGAFNGAPAIFHLLQSSEPTPVT